MFNFLKPKMTVEGLALVFARVVAKVLSPALYPPLAEREEAFVAAGASTSGISLELAAFEAFNVWSGSVIALQKRKISPAHWELFQAAFWKQLSEVVDGTRIDRECFIHRDCNFSEFMDARMELMTALTQGVEVSVALRSIVYAVCENLGRTDSPSGLMLMVQMSYLKNSGSAFDLISGTRLVSGPQGEE